MDGFGKKVITYVGAAVVSIVLIAGLGLLFGYGIMWMWNYVCPELFGLPRITFWQAFWLYVLVQFLFTRGSSSKGSD